ncbi:MAG: chromosome segregation protein SMC [Candidatus Woesearchaeota archaeon]
MTKINKLEMKGFKSFANKTELLFSDEFSCILGPNGSGKSNILDALCFVLGKSSSKSLRAEKSSHLIYNGGKTKNPSKEGEVSIYFDNSSKEFPLAEHVIKISRFIKQNGQSVYKINDKVRTRQQILDLLSAAMINPDGYNIILQGDVMRIVEISADERRKIIEEISGISIYEEKKKKAVNELEKVEQDMKEADIIMQEKETYIKELKKDRDQALKYKELEDMLSQNKASYLNIQIKKKEGEKSVFDEKNEKFITELEKLNNEIDDHKKIVDARKKEIEAINNEIEEKGEKEQVELNKQVENLRVELATHNTRIENCKTQIANIMNRKEQMKNNLDEIDSRISVFTAERTGLEKQKSQIVKDIEKIEKNIAKFREKSNVDDAHEIEQNIEEIDKKAEALETEIAELREKQQNTLREKDKIDFQIDNLDQTIAKVSGIEKEHKRELEELKNMKDQFKKATLELNKRLNDDSELAAQLSTARQRLQSSLEELSRLQVKNVSITESMAGNQAIAKILDNKSKFNVHGTVSDLGNVSSKYSLALEIAAGAKIKSIVVQDDKSAADCIKYLKSNRLGTASFLPLNKIRGAPESSEAKSLAKTNGVFGRAIDLISFDPKFKSVFSYVFGNTLVVQDINVARRIGINKVKMVTLEGDLMELSGAMHGGYRGKRSGIGFKEKEVADRLEKVEQEIADLKSVTSSLDSKRSDNEEEIARLRELKATLEGDIIKKERSLHIGDGDLDATRNQKKDLSEKSKELDKEINDLASKISATNRDFANLKIERHKLRSKVSELRDPKVLAELNTYEQKRQELKEEQIRINSQINSIDTQIATIVGPEKEKTDEIMKQLNKEESDFSNEIKELEKKISLQTKDLKEKEERQKKFYSQFKDLFNKKNKCNEEIQKSDNQISNKNEKIREIERKLNANNLEIARIKAELSGLNEEFAEFKGVELVDKPESELKKEIDEFNRMVQSMGNVNMKALEVYEQILKEYKNLMDKKQTLLSEKNDVLLMMNEIESKKTEMFMETYSAISENFEKIFKLVSHKGDAGLELENPKSPFEGGLRIKVRLSGRKFMDIRSLSGGEKTLTALAFIFAILEHDPAPFYILDEVDAALDKRNSEKLSKLIRSYSEKAQYIMVSHNDGIISEADSLYGISMNEHGISKAISLKI